MYRGVSLFDLDQTLLKENSSYLFGAYLYKNKVFPLSSMLYYVSCYTLHKIGKLSLQDLHGRIFKSLFYGKTASDFFKFASIFVNEKFDTLLYGPAIQRLYEAKRNGHFTAVLSSSPDFLVKIFAEKLNVDHWLATEYGIDHAGHFCKLSEVVQGDVKLNYVVDLSRRLNIPLSEFASYSDSYLDLPFLEGVGNPVGVNPDNKLRAICEQKAWEII